MRTITGTILAAINPDWLTTDELMKKSPEDALGCLSLYKTVLDGHTRVGTAQITVTIDDDKEIIGGMVDSLRAERKRVQANAEVALNRLDERIQSLLAIEYKP